MAAAASSSPMPVDDDIPIEEIVFSCSICQATVSEVYATAESNKGFLSGSGDQDGIVTKMWITECSHVTCTKHLENGAAPFHPKGMAPSAPCPKCSKEKGDQTAKELYGIRGLDDGEYDPVIPSEWRQCPAIKLDSSIPGISAVRFQYMALCHYSRQVRMHWLGLQRQQAVMEAAYSKERKQCRQLQSELQQVETRIGKLEQAELRLKKWEDRKSVITHYMNVVGKLARDNENMRFQLSQFGVVVPAADYAFAPEKASTRGDSQAFEGRQEKGREHRLCNRTSSTMHDEHENSSSTKKRKREDPAPDIFDQGNLIRKTHRQSSRDLMPPPLPRVTPQRTDIPISHTAEIIQQSFVYPHANVNGNDAWTVRQPTMFGTQAGDETNRSRNYDEAQLPQTLPYRTPGRVYRNHRRDRSGITGPISTEYTANPELDQVVPKSHRPVPSSPYFHRRHPPQQMHSYQQTHVSEQPSEQQPRLRASQNGHWISHSLMAGPAAQHQLETERAILYPHARSQSTPRAPTGFPATSTQSQTAWRGPPPVTAAPVASPFFHEARLPFRPPTMQRSPTRASYVSRSNNVRSIHRDSASHQRTPGRYSDQHSGDQAPRTMYVEDPRQFDAQRSYNSSSFPRNSSTQHHGNYGNAPILQTQRKYQPLSQQPEYPPPSAPYSTSRSNPNAFAGRLTLPPSNTRSNYMATEQDGALSMLPGVRGAASRDISSTQRASHVYSDAGNLLSSAGGRRSVRR